MMWSAKCQTGTYMGYTNGKQQCLQVRLNYNTSRELMEVELAVRCRGQLVGSPELDYIRTVRQTPYMLKANSQDNMDGYLNNVYHQCQLKRSPAPHTDFERLFTNGDYISMVEFNGRMVSLKRGKC
ncbi:hypothetical protein FOL47_001770 [Perkinsus chesapeaki]|uniref:Uncharacterized protein n=1 Tax=Perkinsus chesapeaki TaxID=330153 RepID=A0A7J6KSZ7_PERCH|nr:hypothetical protein FOL47_001770 [Perkinsus chesapeaki]